ncbi:MAG: hypothetical protein IJ033_00980 [Clostridia bacterium]|nr:hypothetical protein [Clostridia bacterium]
MKKVLFIFVVLAVVMVSLTACNLVPEEPDVYTELNEMARMSYVGVNLSVQTTMDGVTLTSVYTVTNSSNNTMVSYSSESLATIVQDGQGNYVMPENRVITKTGNATIKNGAIVEQTGDSADIPVKSLEALVLDFNQNYFNMPHGYYENDYFVFKAEVTNVKGFTSNNTFDGKDMSVEVHYNESLEKVMIDYTMDSGAVVKVVYTFN